MNCFDICLDDKTIGIVSIESVGLYTYFRCKCNFSQTGLYRIIARYGTLQIDLGLCIPENNVYITTAKIATKYLNGEIPRFFAVDIKKREGEFIPLNPDQRFDHIAMLPKTKFTIKNETKGVVVNNGFYDDYGVMLSK